MQIEDYSRFLPITGRGTAVDGYVRGKLSRSLREVYARLQSIVAYDESLLQALLKGIDCSPVRPAVFGTYTDLVESLYTDKTDCAHQLSEQLLNLDPSGRGTRIVTLSDDDLGTGQAERYARLIDDDPEQRIQIRPVTDKASITSAVRKALSLIETSAPSLADEISALTREIVLVDPAECPETGELSQFDGASTLYLWGAVFVSVATKSPVDLAQTLAHETGHLLLFGLTMGQPLVDNTQDERYASPLRQDRRPMDGLVHAAYVLARMHYTLHSLLRSGEVAANIRNEACEQLSDYKRSFFDVLTTIQDHAVFTAEGAAIFRGAVDYMSSEQSQDHPSRGWHRTLPDVL